MRILILVLGFEDRGGCVSARVEQESGRFYTAAVERRSRAQD
jgi:hypothetical protein